MFHLNFYDRDFTLFPQFVVKLHRQILRQNMSLMRMDDVLRTVCLLRIFLDKYQYLW